MRIHSVSLPSILVTITCLGPLPVVVAFPQDPLSSFEQDFLERQQEQMQAMEERLEQDLTEVVSLQHQEPSRVIRAARPNQSSFGIAVGSPTRTEHGACGFRPGSA